MSDGDKEGIRDYVLRESSKSVGDDENFDRAVARTAVAQICKSVGFDSVKESALESLTEIAIRCLRDLARTSNSYANLGGRTQGNVFDIILGLDDLSLQPHSSDCLLNFGVLKEIKDYVSSAEEIPFYQPLTRFPIAKTQKLIPSFIKMHESPASTSVPSWLPAFPDPHTYIHTPVFMERETDPRGEKIIQVKQRRKGFKAFLRLQKRLMIHGDHPVDAESALRAAQSNSFLSAGGSIAADNFRSDEPCQSSSSSNPNPFLAEPFKSGDKVISPITLPAKFSTNVSPSIQTSNGGFSDSKLLPVKRQSIHFKFKTAKKLMGESLDLRFNSNGESIMRSDGRDEKKRKEEVIFRQSMKNPQEFAQL